MRKASFVLTGALAMAGWLGVAGTLLVVPATAEAQQKVSQKVGVPLKAAQDSISKKKWDAALAKIKEADAAPGKTAYDQYKINEMLWYVYLQQGRNADAARVLEGQIASGQMPAGEKVHAHQDAGAALCPRGQLWQGGVDGAAIPEVRSGRQGHAAAGRQRVLPAEGLQGRDRRGGSRHEGRRHAEPGPAAARAALQLRAR